MLRSSGTHTDIRTGRPVEPQPQAKQDKATRRYRQTLADAAKMSAALHEDPTPLGVFVKQYAARMQELAQADPICQTLEASINEIRNILEVRPVLAQKAAMRLLGPQLANMVDQET